LTMKRMNGWMRLWSTLRTSRSRRGRKESRHICEGTAINLSKSVRRF
jgi:hypothetical protein